MRVILNGVFDILTVGHFNLLTEARRLAGNIGEVRVFIDSDERVALLKGQVPTLTADERRWQLFTIMYNGVDGVSKRMIDCCDVFDSDVELISLIKDSVPSIMLKGLEYQSKPIIGREHTNVVLINETYFQHEKYSSSDIKQRIIEKSTVQKASS